VKSRAEKQIADYFNENNIKYVYEDLAKTTRSAFRDKISKPDFLLPDYNVYVEYWGLVDVGDSEQRNRYQRDMRWKMRQYYDNGLKFISLYPWHLNDLDGAFKTQFKKALGKDLITGPVNERSVYALSVSTGFQNVLGAGIAAQLERAEVRLAYKPFYFVNYDCFAQGNFLYERVNLQSSGTVVLEGESGRVVDILVKSGTSPDMPQNGTYVDCEEFQAIELPRSKVAGGFAFSKFEAFPAKITSKDAERITQVEIAKNLSETHSRTLKSGKEASKTIRPYANEVRITSAKLANIPILTALFRSKGKSYFRVLQSTTNHVLTDDLIYCNVGKLHHDQIFLVCDTCGSLACKDHGKLCAVCNKRLCVNHVVQKGLILKKFYCDSHVPVASTRDRK
jgi:hypothetical protein